MTSRTRLRRAAASIVLALAAAGGAAGQATSPEKFFGFRLGSDRKIARWDKIVDYFGVLEKQSAGKLKVVRMGPSTMGNPFLLVIVTSARNMQNLERLREVNRRISDPRGIPENEIRQLVAEGKAIVCQTMSLHASEIGGTQMAPELAYDLVTRTDEETTRILDNTILFLVPSFNPDGAIMVSDWYAKTLGTEYEGAELPFMYHKYAGHDNNRDAFQQNLVESRYVAKIMFHDWPPQAYVDHHHMGGYGARIYVPPYAEPIRPLADPLIWREMSWFGAHIAYKEEEAGLSGVLNMAQYSGWGHFGFHWITPFHNIAGMLTESASAKLATPLYIHPHQLEGRTRGMPEYEAQTTFPNPWPGGWWRLRDIIDRQKVSAWGVMDLAARNRETVLWNAYLKAKRQTGRGAEGKPVAYVIPRAQHDPLAGVLLVNKLLGQGLDVREAAREFGLAGGMRYPAGTWVVPLAQPKMGVIRYLLGRTRYPDNEWTRTKGGAPMSPYDMATDTFFEFMGVRVDAVDEPVPLDGARITAPLAPAGTVRRGAAGCSMDGRLNEAFQAANLLLDRGVQLRRADGSGAGLRPGDFVVQADSPALAEVAKQTGVDFRALEQAPAAVHDLKRMRTAMYERYRGGNMDEGWTRLLLEQFRFPYTSIMAADIKKGGLGAKYDVFILPHDSTAAITGDRPPAGPGQPARNPDEEAYPARYRAGIGEEGVKAIKDFVEQGGTLVALGGAGNFAIEKLGIAVRNVTAGRSTSEFWCPGSTLHVRYDNTHPLAYGMPETGLALFAGGSLAYEVVPNAHNERYDVVARFADRDLLESGWLVGEQTLAKKAGAVAVKHKKGQVILLGFRPQHRAQTYGTFKLLFNALLR